MSRGSIPTTRTTHEDVLYWYVTDVAAVGEVLHWGRGLFFLIVLVPNSNGWLQSLHDGLTLDNLERLAAVATHIVIDSFDFEGYIFWAAQSAE